MRKREQTTEQLSAGTQSLWLLSNGRRYKIYPRSRRYTLEELEQTKYIGGFGAEARVRQNSHCVVKVCVVRRSRPCISDSGVIYRMTERDFRLNDIRLQSIWRHTIHLHPPLHIQVQPTQAFITTVYLSGVVHSIWGVWQPKDVLLFSFHSITDWTVNDPNKMHSGASVSAARVQRNEPHPSQAANFGACLPRICRLASGSLKLLYVAPDSRATQQKLSASRLRRRRTPSIGQTHTKAPVA